jgi:hypothetical protein
LALVAGAKARRAGPLHADLFWTVERSERVRLLTELTGRTRDAVVFCRTDLDATRVAGELSRHGVPAATVSAPDFASDRVRVRVLTDDALNQRLRRPSALVVQFDPAPSVRNYRRRVDCAACPSASVVTFVVPERNDEATRLAARLEPEVLLTRPDLAALRLAEAARAESPAAFPSRLVAARRAPERLGAVLASARSRLRPRHLVATSRRWVGARRVRRRRQSVVAEPPSTASTEPVTHEPAREAK